MFKPTLFVLCALQCISIDADRILAVFPTPSISHQIVFRPITQELARRGHEVTVITTDPAFPRGETPENLSEINVHDVSYTMKQKMLASLNNGDQKDILKQTEAINEAFVEIFKDQTAVAEVQELIEKKTPFDLLLLETCFRQSLGFSHIFKVPVISISSLGAFSEIYHVMGAPTHPILYPDPFYTRLYNLTLFEKLNKYYHSYTIRNQYAKSEAKENANVRTIFGADTPDLSDLQNKIAMLFLNVHPVWEGNRPVPPSVVHIGGIHQKPKKELPQDLKQYLDSSTHGVIYLSFGSNVQTSDLPAEKVQAIINVFSQLPYDVLWKCNIELPGRTDNIRTSKWFPQSDLLRHPKVKLFITQGGLQSTEETIIAGVPVIGIPMLGDQWYNVEKYEHHRIGKQINLGDLNEESLMNAIKTVIGDRSYRDNVIRLRDLMYDQPIPPLQRAVWWIEHVLRHGYAHLRSPAANMHWTEYYELKLVLAGFIVWLFAVMAALALLLVLYKSIKSVCALGFSKLKIS